ncbi:MAG: TlpA family protein disulfide reductase, partial [Pseudomonadota bacterium]
IEREPRPASEYALVDARGNRHELADNRGRITLVNFWATWCPPCVHEIPSMNRLAAAYDEREFGIVSINYREEPEHILEFMREVEVDFPVLMDQDGRVSDEWGVFAFPSSFILDREGRIRYSVNTAIEWDTDAVRQVIDALRGRTNASNWY